MPPAGTVSDDQTVKTNAVHNTEQDPQCQNCIELGWKSFVSAWPKTILFIDDSCESSMSCPLNVHTTVRLKMLVKV